MSKALVTGGSGFCGLAIVDRLIELGIEPIVFDLEPLERDVEFIRGSVLDTLALFRACNRLGIHTVYHIAGVLGTTELLQENTRAIDINIKGTVNVLEACHMFGIQNFMYPTKPNTWTNTYTITKKAGEEFVRMFGKLYDMNVTILRWLNVYGPEQKLGPVRKAVPTMCVQAIKGEPIEIYGTGEARVGMVYSRDVAKVTVDYTSLPRLGKRKRDIGCEVEMTVNELAKTIREVAGSKSEIIHLPMRLGEDDIDPTEPLGTASANQVVRCEITPFKEGITRTLDYYRRIISV